MNYPDEKGFAMTSVPLFCSLTLSLAVLMTPQLQAKGLDTLQAETPEVAPTPAGTQTEAPAVAAPPPPPAPVAPAKAGAEPAAAVDASKTAAPLPPPQPPGLQKIYVATGFSFVNLSKSGAGWHSSANGDIEIGHKIKQFGDKLDLFGTFRYRPVAADVVKDERSYRAVVEAFLFGAKSHYLLTPKLTAFGSAEIGVVQTHVTSLDSYSETDKSLEKSGVDLSLGGGVSYLVLEKIGVGSRLALGSGTYKTLQLGLDLRFLF